MYSFVQVTDVLRQRAKQICYGIIYGMGIKSLSEQMSLTEEEAYDLIEDFHEKYPGIRTYINKIVDGCKQNGFVETITGRRRYLPNINHKTLAVQSNPIKPTLTYNNYSHKFLFFASIRSSGKASGQHDDPGICRGPGEDRDGDDFGKDDGEIRQRSRTARIGVAFARRAVVRGAREVCEDCRQVGEELHGDLHRIVGTVSRQTQNG